MAGKWTHFYDMNSGGGRKEKWGHIFIEAPENEARIVFYNRFGHNPERVTCTCCGEDYSISEDDSLEQATGYERGCDYGYFRPDGTECPQEEAWQRGKGTQSGYSSRYVERPSRDGFSHKYRTLEDYLKSGEALVIRADEIKEEERRGEVPAQGCIWQD